MAGDVVIRAEGLGKKYLIGHQIERERYVALRDVLARNARNLWRASVDLARGRPNIEGDVVEEFWALRDVDFEIRRGDVMGVIGRNGAGKSTLLKILSRITEPTEGRVEIHGRVASLLEVGTGFHPELTGRENIYLNGAVLGMAHAEIRRKFDEIVAFAEVERFLDTPVKRFSSGMYVRLAFAVAAHLEPEILIIDEVLAVGDAEFQKKCLGKMGEVAGQGRTILFVSHNMASIATLCSSAILLFKGRVTMVGPVGEVIGGYRALDRRLSGPANPGALFVRDEAETIGGAGLVSVMMFDRAGQTVSQVESCGPVIFRLVVRSTVDAPTLSLFIAITDQSGTQLAKFETDPRLTPLTFAPGEFTVDCELTALPLTPGEYRLQIGVAEYGSHIIEHHDCPTELLVSYARGQNASMSPWADGHLAASHFWRARANPRP